MNKNKYAQKASEKCNTMVPVLGNEHLNSKQIIKQVKRENT